MNKPNQITFATFNLLNYLEPPNAYYDFENIYSFEEWQKKNPRVVYVSATPGEFELSQTGGELVEQVIRPTGLLDPEIEVVPARGQVAHVLGQIRERAALGERVLVTALTKRLSEDLSDYLVKEGVACKWLHSELDAFERVELLRNLLEGTFEALVGVNLLREGLDLPEVSMVAILDADHIPEPNFLTKMVGHFRDEEVGMVQSPHAFSNFDTFQGRVNYEKGRFWDEGLLFYKVIQPGRNATNSVIFAGSAAVFRRKALQEVGYIATETITEDMHTGIRMSAHGWRTVYVSERLIAGQGAADVTTYHSQRLRWAEGNLSILRYDNPLTIRGLGIGQRLTYFASIIHWAGGVPRLALYLTPVLMLLSGVAPVAEITPTLAVVFLTYLSTMMLTLRVIYRGYTNYDLIEFFNMANFWTQMRSTWRAVFHKQKARFVVTHKRGGRQGSTLP
ncbi:glycosyltransferase family 2 protein, partial [Vibrio sp.]|uniref:glycosyltransferase family 2 protein n=1 Tax=Vibrio sp. TaxID=678 RepID=UPI003F6D01BB